MENDVLSTAFTYARHIKGLEELTKFRMKSSITLPCLAKKYFNSLRDENDEPIYSYNDEYVRYVFRQSIKVGRCGIFNHYYKSSISDNVLNIISQELNVQANICESLDE